MDSSILLFFFLAWLQVGRGRMSWKDRNAKIVFFPEEKKNVVNVHFDCNYVVLFECFPALSLVAPSGGKVLAGSGR